MEFVVVADHRVKTKENETKDKYLDFAWELRKLLNMRVRVILVVIGMLISIPKGFVRGLEEFEVGGRIETIQTTALLRSTGILRKVLEILGYLLLLTLQ